MGVVVEEGATDKVREGGGLQEKGAVLWRQTAGKERTGQDREKGGFYQRKERKLCHELEEQRERKIKREKKQLKYCEQTGIVPPEQTGETRGGSHAEHYGYVSNSTVFITPSQCTRVQITTAAHKSFEVM
ncbi:hypothetical protein ABG768_005910 [Culter alburnus]|uniref:Uncharacterized protein n=1 Tax=Culter alburnus TaxID=194366 RepID=A0AAW1ZWD4_CULAL